MEVQPLTVIVSFTATATALLLAGYFALKRRIFLAVVSLGCFLLLFNPKTAMSGELGKPITEAASYWSYSIADING